jgi:signal peptidase II
MANKSSGSLWPWLGIAAIVILVDQVTKALIVDRMALNDSHTITSFFNIVRWHNSGATGWQRWFFVVLGIAAALFIVWMLSRHGAQKLFATALALILGGAIGNVIDRLLHGHVVDFIQVHYARSYFPAFNIADSAITVGAILLILDELLRVRRGR